MVIIFVWDLWYFNIRQTVPFTPTYAFDMWVAILTRLLLCLICVVFLVLQNVTVTTSSIFGQTPHFTSAMTAHDSRSNYSMLPLPVLCKSALFPCALWQIQSHMAGRGMWNAPCRQKPSIIWRTNQSNASPPLPGEWEKRINIVLTVTTKGVWASFGHLNPQNSPHPIFL